jgi:hypothetical protein
MQYAGGVELLIGAHTRLCVWVCEFVFAFLITLHALVCLCALGAGHALRVKQNYFPPRVQINPGRKNCQQYARGKWRKIIITAFFAWRAASAAK